MPKMSEYMFFEEQSFQFVVGADPQIRKLIEPHGIDVPDVVVSFFLII